jgi:hypothetical protein
MPAPISNQREDLARWYSIFPPNAAYLRCCVPILNTNGTDQSSNEKEVVLTAGISELRRMLQMLDGGVDGGVGVQLPLPTCGSAAAAPQHAALFPLPTYSD